MNVIKEKDKKELLERMKLLPWYVQQYLDYKLEDRSPSSLLGYTYDFIMFFGWLISEGLSKAKSINEVTLNELENLRVNDIANFRRFCSIHRNNKKSAIDRKISALKSLFHYLSQIAEDDNLYPLLKRNVMAKIEIKRSVDKKDRADQLRGKILLPHEFEEFIEFVKQGYTSKAGNNKQAIYFYEKNRYRDAAIISLILNSGLRVSEVVNLNLEDLVLNENLVYADRKGNIDESIKKGVYFSDEAKEDIEKYLEVRDSIYSPSNKEKALFLAVKNGASQGTRMSKRAIQAMVLKYAKAFGKPTTVHKLRHSFATDYYARNDIYTTKEQLGHKDIGTTEIYVHLSDQRMKEAINKKRE